MSSNTTRLMSGQALNAGHCEQCSKSVRQGAYVFTHEQGNQSHFLHTQCVLKSLDTFAAEQGSRPEPTCSALCPKITHINNQPVEIESVSRGIVLCQAVIHGDLAEVQTLLEAGGIFSLHLSYAFQAAVQKGSLAIVEEFLKVNPQLAQEDLDEAVMTAARKGREPKGDKIKEFKLNDPRLLNTYSDQYLQILQLLLKDQEISPAIRGNAVVQAVLHGHDEILLQLLKEEIPAKQRGIALCYATEKKQPNTVGVLLRDNREILPTYRLYALNEAMKNGDLESLDALRENTPQDDHDEVFAQVIPQGTNLDSYLNELRAQREELFAASRMDPSSKSLDSLLSDSEKPLFEEWLGKALCFASVKADSLPNMIKLLEKGVSKEKRGEALCLLLKNGLGTLELVDALLAKGAIPNKDRIQAIDIASEKDNWNIVNRLLEGQESISQAMRDRVFTRGVQKSLSRENLEERETMRILLSNGPISADVQKKALSRYSMIESALVDELRGDLPPIVHSQTRYPDESLDSFLGTENPSGTGSNSESHNSRSNRGAQESRLGSNTSNTSSSTTFSSNSHRRARATQQTYTANHPNERSYEAFSANAHGGGRSQSVGSNGSSEDERTTSEVSGESKSIFSSIFSKTGMIKIGKVVLPLLALIGFVVAVVAYLTLGLVNPITISFGIGGVVLGVAAIALYLLTRKGEEKEMSVPLNEQQV